LITSREETDCPSHKHSIVRTIRTAADDFQYWGFCQSRRAHVPRTELHKMVRAYGRPRKQDSARGGASDLPVNQPTKFELVMNPTTVQALGTRIK
jgi:hypothetical protein